MRSKCNNTADFIDAIHPLSTLSGIHYFWSGDYKAKGKKMIDRTTKQVITDALTDENLGIGHSFELSQEIVMGTHYDVTLKGRHNCRGGSKGLLDLSIVTLIARKLLADYYSYESERGVLHTLLMLSFVLPVELVRFNIGMALSFALIPVVALVIMCNNLLFNNATESYADKPDVSLVRA